MVVGLGNPGAEYAGTRHNVGFHVLEHLALREGLLFEDPRTLEDFSGPSNFEVARSHDPDALLVKPTTYMNLSGEAVLPLLEWAGGSVEDVLVVYDDMDLPFGRLRLRPHGGAGGQKGMISILETLESDRFPRLRVGIGRPETDAARHVLSTFGPEEQGVLDELAAEAADAIHLWLRNGDVEECMTRFQSRWNQGTAP